MSLCNSVGVILLLDGAYVAMKIMDGLYFVLREMASIAVVMGGARSLAGMEKWMAIRTPPLCNFPGSTVWSLRVMVYSGMLR